MLITLKEYAGANHRTPSMARRLAKNGRFKTAQKLGRDWMIDSDEPWPEDKRIVDGEYIGLRKKKGKDK